MFFDYNKMENVQYVSQYIYRHPSVTVSDTGEVRYPYHFQFFNVVMRLLEKVKDSFVLACSLEHTQAVSTILLCVGNTVAIA